MPLPLRGANLFSDRLIPSLYLSLSPSLLAGVLGLIIFCRDFHSNRSQGANSLNWRRQILSNLPRGEGEGRGRGCAWLSPMGGGEGGSSQHIFSPTFFSTKWNKNEIRRVVNLCWRWRQRKDFFVSEQKFRRNTDKDDSHTHTHTPGVGGGGSGRVGCSPGNGRGRGRWVVEGRRAGGAHKNVFGLPSGAEALYIYIRISQLHCPGPVLVYSIYIGLAFPAVHHTHTRHTGAAGTALWAIELSAKMDFKIGSGFIHACPAHLNDVPTSSHTQYG